MFDRHGRVNTSSHVEVTGDLHITRPTDADQIIQYLVCDGLVKSALIAVGPQIEFQ